MLRVRVELIPWGNHNQTETMFEAYVYNDGSGHGKGVHGGGTGNYRLMACHPPGMGRPAEELDLGQLLDVERIPSHRLKMAYTALQRLEEAVDKAVADERIKPWRQGDKPNIELHQQLELAVLDDPA